MFRVCYGISIAMISGVLSLGKKLGKNILKAMNDDSSDEYQNLDDSTRQLIAKVKSK